jgi:hypothetical protein
VIYGGVVAPPPIFRAVSLRRSAAPDIWVYYAGKDGWDCKPIGEVVLSTGQSLGGSGRKMSKIDLRSSVGTKMR